MDGATRGSLYNQIGGRDGIRELLKYFYADVRQHREIGPIFNAKIKDWPAHLEKIADFWSNATGGPILYSGPMPLKHVQLMLGEKHFEAWLDLWRRQCRIRLPKEAAEELIRRAEGIGARLQDIISDYQHLQRPTRPEQ